MSTPGNGNLRWFVDVRPVTSTEHMSLDLSRHLPRRLAVGPAVIVTDRPAVFLSVIRKRWVKIIHEVTRQRASTLDSQKKAGLTHELAHLKDCRFTIKPFKQFPTADCFFVSPAQLTEGLPPCYPTLYLTTWLSAESLLNATRNLPLNGVIISYGEWPTGYEDILCRAFFSRLCQYGEQEYPNSQAPKY
jgi:hypothetical protein